MVTPKCRWESPQQWSEWSDYLAAGLHARNRWRLAVLLMGILFAQGRRTVTTWLRAAGVSDDFQDYDYFLAALPRKTESVLRADFYAFAASLDTARSVAGGDRRFAHPALRPESRRGRHPSQPHARPTLRVGARRPIRRICTDIDHRCAAVPGSRCRWRCGIRSGARWHCRCAPLCTSAARRFPVSSQLLAAARI